MNILNPIIILLGVFLYTDRFLFRGELIRLFLQGWRQILRVRPRKASPPAALESLSSVSGEYLVVRKEYAEGTERQAGEQAAENESTDERKTTFTSATEASAQPEILEWRDPNYFSDQPSKKSSNLAQGADPKSSRWEDDDFAGGISDTELSHETEHIQREVAASLEDWMIEEVRIEMEMSAEEASDVEAFDVNAFQ